MKAGRSLVYLEGPFILQVVNGALKFPIHIEEIAGIQLEFSQTQPFGAKADATDKQDVVGSWHVALFLIICMQTMHTVNCARAIVKANLSVTDLHA